MGKNMQKIEVQGTEISVNLSREEDYISFWVFGNVSIIRILIMANSP